jgi:IclR family transcriptional regulator, acetate operon repressor
MRCSEDEKGSSVLERAFRLLEALSVCGGSVGLATLAERSNLAKPTAYRMLSQLCAMGMVSREGRNYRLGLRLFELGSLLPETVQLRDLTQRFERDLYEITHETVHVAIRTGTEVLYLDKLCGDTPIPATRIGIRRPLYCTGLGKAILAASPPEVLQATMAAGLRRYTRYTITDERRLAAEIEQIRTQGVAFDRGEFHLGVHCVAAPVLDKSGGAMMAISVAGPAVPRFNMDRLAYQVKRAAGSISSLLRDPRQPRLASARPA